MQVEVTVEFKIKTNHETKVLDAICVDEESFEVDEYIERIDFNYSDIFRIVASNLVIGGEYPIPTNEDEFNHSQLWHDLDFNTPEDFVVQVIFKSAEIQHSMTYGKKAEVAYDMMRKEVIPNVLWMVHNELDTAIFDFDIIYDSNEEQIGGGQCLDELVEIFGNNWFGARSKDKLVEDINDYFSERTNEDLEPVSSEFVQTVTEIMKAYFK